MDMGAGLFDILVGKHCLLCESIHFPLLRNDAWLCDWKVCAFELNYSASFSDWKYICTVIIKVQTVTLGDFSVKYCITAYNLFSFSATYGYNGAMLLSGAILLNFCVAGALLGDPYHDSKTSSTREPEETPLLPEKTKNTKSCVRDFKNNKLTENMEQGNLNKDHQNQEQPYVEQQAHSSQEHLKQDYLKQHWHLMPEHFSYQKLKQEPLEQNGSISHVESNSYGSNLTGIPHQVKKQQPLAQNGSISHEEPICWRSNQPGFPHQVKKEEPSEKNGSASQTKLNSHGSLRTNIVHGLKKWYFDFKDICSVQLFLYMMCMFVLMTVVFSGLVFIDKLGMVPFGLLTFFI